MSKKTNTLIFILVGTFFNIFITISCFLGFLLIYSRFFYDRFAESSSAWLLPVFFIAAIAASFFVYRLAIKLFMKKVDMEKHFDPIFAKRRSTGK